MAKLTSAPSRSLSSKVDYELATPITWFPSQAVSPGGNSLIHGETPLLNEFVSKKELATSFGVSSRTIERWVRMRLLPAPVRLGRTSLYHLPTVKQHLEDRARGNVPRSGRTTTKRRGA